MIPTIIHSQQMDIDDNRVDEILEKILSLRGDDSGFGEIQEELNHLLNNPVNINRAEEEDLNVFFFLTKAQVDSLLSYRERHGAFLAQEELRYVNGFNSNILDLIMPFITAGPVYADKGLSFKKWIGEGDKSLLARYSRQVEKPAGYDASARKPGKYIGNPDQYLLRFRLSVPAEMSAGFTSEKDKGEPLIWSPAMHYFGADHYTYHFALLNRGKLKSFVLGDYKVSYGQGLIMGNSFYLGKSTETIGTIRNKTTGIRPYSGSGESGFFRGGAAEISLGYFSAAGYLSARNLDSRIEDLDPGDEKDEVIRGFITTGMHRTSGEIKNRKNSLELTAGYRVSYSNNTRNFSLGASSVIIQFDRPYLEVPVYYNQYDFSGERYNASGIDYNYYHRKFNIFGEFATSGAGSIGMVNGIIGNLSKNIETSLHIRHYSRGFNSLYGNPFRESGTKSGESGIYWGIKIMPARILTLNFYYDTYRFPWLRYNLKSPAAGTDIFVRILVLPARKIEIYGQFLKKTIDTALRMNGNGIDEVEPGIRNRYWLQVSWLPGSWEFRSRVQYSSYQFNGSGTGGIAAFLDAGIRIRNYNFHGRFTWFMTEDYNNRQYIYERGALYDFQVPLFYGQGMRTYILANMKISRQFHIWIKAGRTKYNNTNTIGSGLEKITGNHRTELMIQLEYKF